MNHKPQTSARCEKKMCAYPSVDQGRGRERSASERDRVRGTPIPELIPALPNRAILPHGLYRRRARRPGHHARTAPAPSRLRQDRECEAMLPAKTDDPPDQGHHGRRQDGHLALLATAPPQNLCATQTPRRAGLSPLLGFKNRREQGALPLKLSHTSKRQGGRVTKYEYAAGPFPGAPPASFPAATGHWRPRSAPDRRG